MTKHRTETQKIRRRIMDVLPAATFQMHKMLGTIEIVLSDLSPTACIECVEKPRLHLNPEFLEQHCQVDEHLFMLIMHELNHLLLGHTRLFDRPDKLANIAFDAIINAKLCHQFPDPRYTSFFTKLNPADTMPGCLLRPPEGWEYREDRKMDDGVDWLRMNREMPAARMIQELYGASRWRYTTYLEIFELLRKAGDRNFEDDVVLLGDHDEKNGHSPHDEEVLDNRLFMPIFERITAGWPAPKQQLADRFAQSAAGCGTDTADQNFQLPEAMDGSIRAERALKKLLARAGAVQRAGAPRRLQIRETARILETVLPLASDRRVGAFRAIWGHEPVFYRGMQCERRLQATRVPACHVYLDISGSMDDYLPAFVAAMRRPHRQGLMKAFVFSNVVSEVGPRKLTEGYFHNTYGTDIACVLQHFLAIPKEKRPRRMLILTDGLVGCASDETLAEVTKSRIKIYVGLTPDGSRRNLDTIATHIETLPLFD